MCCPLTLLELRLTLFALLDMMLRRFVTWQAGVAGKKKQEPPEGTPVDGVMDCCLLQRVEQGDDG